MAKTVSGNPAKLANPPHKRRSIWHHFSVAKEGVITGAADNDPSNIGTFAQAGASTGFALLWLVVLTAPLVIAIEQMSARVGVATRKGLSAVIRQHCGAGWAIMVGVIVLVCNTVTVGADIAAVSEITGVLTHVRWEWFVLPLAILLSALLIGGSYAMISRYLLIVTFALLAYLATAFVIKIDFATMADQLWPLHLNGPLMFAVIATSILGTVISPYVIFWQTDTEVEAKATFKDLRQENIGVVWGFVYTTIIAIAILVVAASAFGGSTLINSTTEAARMLNPIAGRWAFLLFSVGILGSGLVGIPVLAASTAYAGAEALGWKVGLNQRVAKARGFYSIMIGAILISILLVLTKIPPMAMLVYSQIINTVFTPVLILILMWIINNRKIMGKHVGTWWLNLGGAATIIVMIAFDILLLTKIF